MIKFKDYSLITKTNVAKWYGLWSWKKGGHGLKLNKTIIKGFSFILEE